MKQNQYDCIIIGGGAAGMMAAIESARSHLRTAILEHTDRIGTKLLQTGNGKCNFTNLNLDENCYQNEDKELVRKVLHQFTVQDTLEFFEGIGVYHKDRNGYVYPHSETAASLQDALRYEVEQSGTNLVTGCQVRNIKIDQQGLYQIDTDKGLFCAPAVILATGSKAAPRTGSDGSGYELAAKLGHKIKKALPALVQLVSPDKMCKSMSGVRSTGSIRLYVEDKEVAEDTGEIQYTDYGISGIPVFQISRYAVAAIDRRRNVHAIIDMLPDMEEQRLIDSSVTRAHNEKNKTAEQFFSGLINKKLVHGACKVLGINQNAKITELKDKQIIAICRQLKAFRIELNDFKPFEQAQICQGGVSTGQIDEHMQSTLHPGLYFAGELVDVDGKCGGYNLQWAWSSAVVAARAAVEQVRKVR